MNYVNQLAENPHRAQAADMTRFLIDHIVFHSQAPCVLGWGAMSLEQKLSGMIWPLFLETGSKDLLDSCARCTESFCTYMGTEFSFNGYHAKSPAILLPELFGDVELHADADDCIENEHGGAEPPGLVDSESDGDAMQCDCDIPDRQNDGHPGLVGSASVDETQMPDPFDNFQEFLFPRSLRVPGLCHVCHNSLKDVCSVLTSWPLLQPVLGIASKIFGHIGRRERFIEKCIKNTPWRKSEFLFKKNMPSFLELRWGSINEVCRWLWARAKVIIGAWRTQSFLYGDNDLQSDKAGDDADALSDGDVTKFGMSVNTCAFWARVLLVLQLGGISDALMRWAGTCPCHGRLFEEADDRSRDSILRRLLGRERLHHDECDCRQVITCPLTGCLAPELAMGEHLVIIERETRQLRGHLVDFVRDLAEFRLEVSQIVVDEVVENFDLGSEHAAAVLRMKTMFASTLPFVICAAAHPDEERAKAKMREVIERFDQCPDTALHDRHTLAWLGAGTRGSHRAELDAWCSGERPLREFRRLQLSVARKRLVPIHEIRGEAPHAKVKTKISFKPSQGKQASLRLRMPEIRMLMRRDPSFTQALASDIEGVRKEMDCCKSLGLLDHPQMLKWISLERSTLLKYRANALHKHITALLYRFDAESQFEKHSKVRREHGRASNKRKYQEDKVVHGRTGGLTYERLRSREWMAHVRQSIAAGDILEIDTSDLGGPTLASMPEHMAQLAGRLGPAPVPDDDSDVEMAVDGDCMQQSSSAGILYLRVVHPAPSRRKLLRPRAGAARNLQNGDMCVSVLSSLVTDAAGPLLRTLSGSNATFILSDLPSNFTCLRERGFKAWSFSKESKYYLPGVATDDDAAADAMAHLVAAGAWSSDTAAIVPASQAKVTMGMQRLLRHGYVQHLSDVRWCLTHEAQVNLSFAKRVSSPRLLCEARAEMADLAIEDLTNYEIMLQLEEHGWTWSSLPKKQNRECLQNIDLTKLPDIQRVWYGDFERQYQSHYFKQLQAGSREQS